MARNYRHNRHEHGKGRFSCYRGLTLVEMLISISIISLLLGALASTVLLATKAIPDPDDPGLQALAAVRVTEHMLQELQEALNVNVATATSVEFTVADRDSDNNAETIRYAFSGTAGDPLTRQYNSGAIVNVLDNVQEFNLQYMTKTVTSSQQPAAAGD